jgi:hypothetical protein
MSADYVEKYLHHTHPGKELLKRHELLEVGLWRIRGEDPNCDFGGHHHQPDLGVFEGTLDDAIKYAVNLDGFWTWGGGGNIDLVRVINRQEGAKQMTAEEARKLNLEYIMEQVRLKHKAGSLDQRIKDAAMKGSTQIRTDIDRFEEKIRAPFYEAIRNEYTSKGFEVKRVAGEDDDPRDYSSWDYILISW